MAGRYDGSIRINTLLNTDNFTGGVRNMRNDVNRLGRSIAGVRSSLGGLVKSLGVGLSIAGIVALGKQAIETASDIAEVQNVVDTAFGSMSYIM